MVANDGSTVFGGRSFKKKFVAFCAVVSWMVPGGYLEKVTHGD